MGSQIVRAYLDFWAGFCNIVQGHTVVPSHNAPLPLKEDGRRVFLSSPIALISWPCKKDPSGTIDIVVYYEMTVEQIARRVQRITSSKAYVLYFHGGIGTSPLVQILRFEYEPACGMDDGDPLFHVQLGGKRVISRNQLPELLQRRWTYRNQPISAIESHVHIPTPRMLLPDLLCFIVADHLRGRVHDLVDHTRRTIAELSSIVCDESYARPEFWDQIPAPNWYRRAPVLSA